MKDKNGNFIKVGQRIRHDKGEIRSVVNICGVTMAVLKADQKVISSKVFKRLDLKEWEIVK